MAVTGSVVANLSALLTGAAGGLGVASVKHPLEVALNITNGTGANQCNKVWSRKDQSLAASSSETWDLAGSLTDALGTTVVFSAIKVIFVFAKAANVNNVVIGGDAAHVLIFDAALDSVSIRPGNPFLLTNLTAAGWTVTGTTADLIKVTNSGAGTAEVYDIAVLGI